MVIKREQDGHFTCLVERPKDHPPSYLFFTEVKLKVNGGSIKSAMIHVSRHIVMSGRLVNPYPAENEIDKSWPPV